MKGFTTLRFTTEWLNCLFPVVNITLSIQTGFSLEYEAGNSVCTKKTLPFETQISYNVLSV